MGLEITDESLEDFLEAKIAVVDFWAAWCAPCRMLTPTIDELSNDNEDNPSVKIGKINVDSNPKAAATYGIRSIPAVLFFKDGELVDKVIGINTKQTYQKKIDFFNSTD